MSVIIFTIESQIEKKNPHMNRDKYIRYQKQKLQRCVFIFLLPLFLLLEGDGEWVFKGRRVELTYAEEEPWLDKGLTCWRRSSEELEEDRG